VFFPSGYVHLGGDECPVDEWTGSPRARERAAELGLAGPQALHGWFTAQLATHVARRGCRPIGWDELAAGTAPRETAITCWHGTATAEAAARLGHDVILAPWQETYFDLHQAEHGEPRGQRGVLTLEQSHAFDPFAGALGGELAARLLGAQCQLWTEYIPGLDHLDYMAFPRVTAFADRAWGHALDYADFRARLTPHLRRLDALGVHYRRPEAAPEPDTRPLPGPGPRPVAPAGV
jgi:hexosaminidase